MKNINIILFLSIILGFGKSRNRKRINEEER